MFKSKKVINVHKSNWILIEYKLNNLLSTILDNIKCQDIINIEIKYV